MTETSPDASATDTQQETAAETQPKPTDTVDFWKQKAREQEKRAKENAEAAKRLGELEQANKSEVEKANDRVVAAEAEAAKVPALVSAALRDHLVELHKIPDEKAELFLTATDPALLLRQVTALVGETKKQGNHVPREGSSSSSVEGSDREAVRAIFGGSD